MPLPSRRHSAPAAAIHNKSQDLTAYSQPHEKVFYFTSSASFARHTECTSCLVGRLIARHVHSLAAHGNNVHRHICSTSLSVRNDTEYFLGSTGPGAPFCEH